MELDRVGAGAGGPAARRMLDLGDPDLGFARIAEGFGVPATVATDAEGFTTALERALAEPGPHLIEAVLAAG
jgi:acetolactate synthase-1/2/3 large subunit